MESPCVLKILIQKTGSDYVYFYSNITKVTKRGPGKAVEWLEIFTKSTLQAVNLRCSLTKNRTAIRVKRSTLFFIRMTLQERWAVTPKLKTL